MRLRNKIPEIFSRIEKFRKIQEPIREKEVQLNAVQDLTNTFSNLVKHENNDSAVSELFNIQRNINGAISEAKDYLSEFLKLQGKAIEEARALAKMADDLGVDKPMIVDDVFSYNGYDDALNQISGYADTIYAAAKKL